MHNKFLDSLIGFACGLIGGCTRYLQISLQPGFASRIIEAGITAFICGMLGVAGKHAIAWCLKKYQNRKKIK